MNHENTRRDATCQLHELTMEKVNRHEKVLYGCDEEGGLVASVRVYGDTLATIKKLLYGIIGLMGAAVITGILNLVINNPRMIQ